MEDVSEKIRVLLGKLLQGRDLDFEEAFFFLDNVAGGKVSDTQIAAILVALQQKTANLQEILGFARAIRQHAVPFPFDGLSKKKKWDYPFIDTCGTGGDNKNTFNVSTLAALVVAGCGVPVLKHGNRSVSSSCGSADLLKGLGVRVDCTPKDARECLIASNMAFLFAPLYHPAMKCVALVRKELGVRTIFNFLGPLLHPASVECQFVGVFSAEVQQSMADSLRGLGVKNFMVVHSEDGMDEVSIFAKSHVIESFGGKEWSRREINPADLGFVYSARDYQAVAVANITESLTLAKDVLAGKKSPARDMVLLNAACSLMVVGAAKNLKQGIEMASLSIDQKKAQLVLQKMVDFFSTSS